MNLACNLYVDGVFEGIIQSSKEVNIGKNGHIKGDVSTTRLVVQGYIEGSVNAARVEIKAHGRVNGSIESSELVIEAKGIFEGSSVVKGVKSAPKAQEISEVPSDTIKS
jgi:cytoskeletal protein CcmA (bactofilin family)